MKLRNRVQVTLGIAIALAASAITATTIAAATAEFDLVLTGGRVMDPESGLDAVRSIGIREAASPIPASPCAGSHEPA